MRVRKGPRKASESDGWRGDPAENIPLRIPRYSIAAANTADLAVETPKEWDKALRETLAKIMDYSIKKKTAQMDPADLQGLQQLVDAKRRLQQLGRLHISL